MSAVSNDYRDRYIVKPTLLEWVGLCDERTAEFRKVSREPYELFPVRFDQRAAAFQFSQISHMRDPAAQQRVAASSYAFARARYRAAIAADVTVTP